MKGGGVWHDPQVVVSSLRLLLVAVLLVPGVAGAQTSDEAPPERAGQSVEVPGGAVVPMPAPLPPPELIARDLRVERSTLLLDRLDVFDTYVARLARQTRRVLAADPIDCAALGTLEHALALALKSARAASKSVAAELSLLPEFEELLDLRDRAEQAAVRRAEVESIRWPALEASLEGLCESEEARPPTVWVPEDERGAVDGYALLFVRTRDPDQVVWVDGAPAGRSDATGWATLAVPVASVRLCVADPEEEACRQLVEVKADPLVAFDLSE